MVTLSAHLRDLHPQLVEAATRSLARGEDLRQSIGVEVARFYDLLLEAVNTGSPTWLDDYVHSWVAGKPAHLAGEDIPTLLGALHSLRTATFQVLGEHLSSDEALRARDELEPIIVYAVELLAALERDAVLAEITQDLERTRRDVEKLDKSKSDFIAVAAHELKTPLTLIEGYSNMLGEEVSASNPGVEVVLGGIANGTRRLKEIIEDMIDVSMIDNNLLALNYQPVWITQLLGICRTELDPALRERRHSLRVDNLPGSNRPIYADPERLFQVFMNVLRNAIKYTPDGGKITVSGRELPGFLEVTVADTGIGIPLERQQEIFEKFSSLGDVSLHSSGKTKFKGGGPGLGLPIARGILEAHGGAIWVESPGYDEKACPGSIFHLMIPIKEKLPETKVPKLFGLTDEEKKAMGME